MKYFYIVLMLLFLSACAGTPFKWDDARKIQAGMTTQEVTALIGPPYSITASGDVVRYVWVEVSMIDHSSKTLRIDFRDSKAVKAPPIPSEFQ